MLKLIAKYPILYLSKQYNIGDEIIANNSDMVAAWIDADTAEWIDDEESVDQAEVTENTVPSAVPVSAEAGLTGEVTGEEDGDDLVGKIPKTPARARK
ncbi:hypothetical protein J4O15_03795 [Lachnoanaerobaculum sp. Marseille-Q4761]|uniref:hypothetical protein n=1 Tax=Lachnoanaerobaculum sp. Marseille-Q4761 TaxID=2819511 RepID=UPI001AA14CCB|nr:hypothetical protein [Lachnoanaerobaculum sp. Marseille-Q4761]MBO1870081.1 hypothetical protein [Lachnoanaerobaculum sp. Marseille-Q4761]